MDNLSNNSSLDSILGNWDWQPRKLKEQFGQLTLGDVTLRLGRQHDMIVRLGMRLGKTRDEIINLIRNL